MELRELDRLSRVTDVCLGEILSETTSFAREARLGG